MQGFYAFLALAWQNESRTVGEGIMVSSMDTWREPSANVSDPLSCAVEERDRQVIAMVERAIEREEVMLAYQPVILAKRPERPAFFEGLIRVLDHSGRTIPARQFFPQVETSEIGRRLDVLALRQGMAALASIPTLRLSINLSARSIDYPLWMAELERGLADDPSVGERLILEITESSAITMPHVVTDFIARLQERGIAFALDDFGSGYTSMKYLKDFCFDILKMDGEFCLGAAESPDNRALIRAVVSIAQHFDMLVVAESVETASDAAALTSLGVDCLQGYHFGAPSLSPRWRSCEAYATGG